MWYVTTSIFWLFASYVWSCHYFLLYPFYVLLRECVVYVLNVGCSFLSISTTYAKHGSGFVVPSAAAKAGVEAITKLAS